MDRVNWRLTNKIGSHWVKVKFYNDNPPLKEGRRLEDIRFCEAVKKAIIEPVLLDKDSITCPGAQYAFGWKPGNKKEFLKSCQIKNNVQTNILESMFSRAARFKKPFKYIGLNTDGEPDLVMSFMPVAGVMELIKLYNYRCGDNLDVSLSGMMSICGGVAVKTYLDGKINFSFGCDDSRKFAGLGRDTLAVGIPNKLFKIFVD